MAAAPGLFRESAAARRLIRRSIAEAGQLRALAGSGLGNEERSPALPRIRNSTPSTCPAALKRQHQRVHGQAEEYASASFDSLNRKQKAPIQGAFGPIRLGQERGEVPEYPLPGSLARRLW